MGSGARFRPHARVQFLFLDIPFLHTFVKFEYSGCNPWLWGSDNIQKEIFQIPCDSLASKNFDHICILKKSGGYGTFGSGVEPSNIGENFQIKRKICYSVYSFEKSRKFGLEVGLWSYRDRRDNGTQGQLEFPQLALQFLGYIFENCNECGRQRTQHNKTYIPFSFALSHGVPVSR